jgi:hypothetical protein
LLTNISININLDINEKIFGFWFFHESVSPHPQSIPLGPFQIFMKVCGDIRKSRCTTGINDTGGKFCHQLLILVANLPPVSVLPVANLPPVSTSLAANLPLVSMTPVNLKAKMYLQYKLTLLPNGVQTK